MNRIYAKVTPTHEVTVDDSGRPGDYRYTITSTDTRGAAYTRSTDKESDALRIAENLTTGDKVTAKQLARAMTECN